MAEIQESRIGDIVSELPELVPWDARTTRGMNISLLIVCAGFEDRTVAVTNALMEAAIEEVLIIEYPTNPEDNVHSVATLSGMRATNIQRMTYRRSDFFYQPRLFTKNGGEAA